MMRKALWSCFTFDLQEEVYCQDSKMGHAEVSRGFSFFILNSEEPSFKICLS